MFVQIMGANNALGKVKLRYDQLGASEDKIKKLDELIDQISKVTTTRRSEIKEEPPLGPALREISFVVPRTVQFKEMSFQKDPEFELSFAGVVRGGGRTEDIVLSSFLENLDDSELFEHSRLDSRSGEGNADGPVAFTIMTQLVK